MKLQQYLNNFAVDSKLAETVLGDISNLQLVIFGIVVTLFTVLYSFIANKKEEIQGYKDLILKNQASDQVYIKSKFGSIYIDRLRKVNGHLINLIVLSFITYFLAYFTKTFFLSEHVNQFLFYGISSVAIFIILYITLILFKVINFYKLYTKR
ncbi:hypothetical protein OB13_20635 [Pontibacter sp. HJ8]